MNYGWQGTIQEFLMLTYDKLEEALMTFVYGSMDVEQSEEDPAKINSQRRAWKDSFIKLQEILQDFKNTEGSVIFEYAILRGSGRRPDVLLLLPGNVLVIECKSYNQVNEAEYVQTSMYVRDLQSYHSTVHEKELTVRGALFLTNSSDERYEPEYDQYIYEVSQAGLKQLITQLVQQTSGNIVRAIDIIEGTFQASPSMLEGARSIFNNEKLPRVKAMDSSNYEEVYETVQEVIKEAKATNTHHLILVSGEPGSGKTLLGLETAHNTPEAVYLSGNGPLIHVLQDILQNRTFVQSLYGFKTDYLRYGKTPAEKVMIFDEAQRAWDAERMKGPLSEPDVIIEIMKQKKDWGVMIGLIGDGQEIHLGEEGGLALWNTAIKGQDIVVHAKHANEAFKEAASYHQHEHLHLNSSLRSHAALEYHNFVNDLLAGDIEKAKELLVPLKKQRYPIFLTDDLDKAKAYLKELYLDDVKTYGIVCASGADSKKQMNVLPFSNNYDRPNSVQAYFNYPTNPYYCKNLNYMATEFQIQGLELDMAVVHWDEDFYWQDNQWAFARPKRGASNPEQMKTNAYRVLLTRGRDGLVIYLPKIKALAKTWDLFANVLGISVL